MSGHLTLISGTQLHEPASGLGTYRPARALQRLGDVLVRQAFEVGKAENRTHLRWHRRQRLPQRIVVLDAGIPRLGCGPLQLAAANGDLPAGPPLVEVEAEDGRLDVGVGPVLAADPAPGDA